MATDVMSSLFGLTPEALQASRERQLQEQALRFAQLDPMQQAQMGFFTAGSRLGTGLAGLLGAEDPQMKMISQRQQLLQGVDPTDIESLQAAAKKAIEAKDFTLAQSLATRIQDMRVKNAAIQKDIAAANRERKAAIPADIQTAQRIADLRAAIPALEAAGDPTAALLKNELAELTRLTTKEGTLSDLGKLIRERGNLDPVKDADKIKFYDTQIRKLTSENPQESFEFLSIAKGLGYGVKNLTDYTDEQVKRVDEILQARKVSRTPKTEVIVPGIKEVKDVADLRSKVRGTVSENIKGYEAADRALAMADDAIRSSSFASAEGVASQLAKASGDTQLSNRDVQKYRTDPSFVGSVADVTKRLLTGTPTADTLRKLREYARLIKLKQEESINRELDTQRKLAKRSGFKDEDIDIAFGGIIGTSEGGKARRTKSGVTYTVED